jgi:hypothetical protein
MATKLFTAVSSVKSSLIELNDGNLNKFHYIRFKYFKYVLCMESRRISSSQNFFLWL